MHGTDACGWFHESVWAAEKSLEEWCQMRTWTGQRGFFSEKIISRHDAIGTKLCLTPADPENLVPVCYSFRRYPAEAEGEQAAKSRMPRTFDAVYTHVSSFHASDTKEWNIWLKDLGARGPIYLDLALLFEFHAIFHPVLGISLLLAKICYQLQASGQEMASLPPITRWYPGFCDLFEAWGCLDSQTQTQTHSLDSG